MANDSLEITAIVEKISSGVNITEEEELLYLTSIVGLPELKAKQVLAIANNRDPLVIVD